MDEAETGRHNERLTIVEPVVPAPRGGPRRAWSSLVEERIRVAAEQGAFDNLPGAGKPLRIDENPLAGSRALAFSLLKANGVAPREIELGREIDTDLALAEALVERLRARREELATRHQQPIESERRAFRILRGRVERQYADALLALRRKALTLNTLAPTPLHRVPIDVDARLAAFRQEFPATEGE